MRIRVLSDLHLELGMRALPAVDCDVVVLAGDIHGGVEGVRWAKRAFRHTPVIYVAGNHELHHSSMPGLVAEVAHEAEGSNVQVLEQRSVEVGGVTFLGCTLWTDLGLFGDPDISSCEAQVAMVDYRLIRRSHDDRRSIRPADTRAWHQRSLAWLRDACAESQPRRVVVTHHAPSAASLDPAMAGHPIGPAYASNLEPLVEELAPSLWAHGHIHRAAAYEIGSTRVVCNPAGYPGKTPSGFDPRLVIEV